MNPDYLVGSGILALALGTSGLLHSDGLTPEQRQQRREEAAIREAVATAAKRAASADVAKAEAKRARKAEKLRAIASRGVTP